jgi:hypothetical protein
MACGDRSAAFRCRDLNVGATRLIRATDGAVEAQSHPRGGQRAFRRLPPLAPPCLPIQRASAYRECCNLRLRSMQA